MKKLLILLITCLSLCGCQNHQYTLYFFYASTCPVCKSFRNHVIPDLKETYHSKMKIVEYDIDEETSMDQYASICSHLKHYHYSDTSGNVPFIVLDGYFARVGYEIGEEETMENMIQDAIDGKNLTEIEDYEDIEFYIFEEEE